MKTFIGIDLGSTTTKAVVMDERRTVLGRGITNSRSNYDTAAAIAKQEALLAARFVLFRKELEKGRALNGGLEAFIGQLERDFRLEQYLEQLADLAQVCERNVKFGDASSAVSAALRTLFTELQGQAAALFAPGARRKSECAPSRTRSRMGVSRRVICRREIWRQRVDVICKPFGLNQAACRTDTPCAGSSKRCWDRPGIKHGRRAGLGWGRGRREKRGRARPLPEMFERTTMA